MNTETTTTYVEGDPTEAELSPEQLSLLQLWRMMTLPELVRELALARARKEQADEVARAANWAHDHLRLIELVKKMEDTGITNVTVEGVGRVTLVGDLYARIPAAKRTAAYEWLRDNGHGDLITETVNASTLKAAVRTMLKKGEELPSDLLVVTPYTRAQLTSTAK